MLEFMADVISVFKEHGWGVLFAIIAIGETVWILKVLLADRKGLLAELQKERDRSAALATVLERRNQADAEIARRIEALEVVTKQDQEAQRQFLTFLQMKERFYGGQGNGPA